MNLLIKLISGIYIIEHIHFSSLENAGTVAVFAYIVCLMRDYNESTIPTFLEKLYLAFRMKPRISYRYNFIDQKTIEFDGH